MISNLLVFGRIFHQPLESLSDNELNIDVTIFS